MIIEVNGYTSAQSTLLYTPTDHEHTHSQHLSGVIQGAPAQLCEQLHTTALLKDEL